MMMVGGGGGGCGGGDGGRWAAQAYGFTALNKHHHHHACACAPLCDVPSCSACLSPCLSPVPQELNSELGRLRRESEAGQQAAAAALDEGRRRLAACEAAKAELSRHFGNVMEDVKAMKVRVVPCTYLGLCRIDEQQGTVPL